MALQKQAVPLNFAQGLDTKSDPKQVQLGKFLVLNNSVFGKGGLLQKRNGYEQLTTVPTAQSLSKFNENLVAISDTITAYSEGSGTTVDRGVYQPLSLATLPLVRSNSAQTQADSATSPNGLILTAYTDNVPSGGSTTPVYKYGVQDATTGQNIIVPTVIVSVAGAVTSQPRVFALANFLVVVYSVGSSLRYFAVSSASPQTPTVERVLSVQYAGNADTLAFDGVVANNALYMAWNGSDGGGAIRTAVITSTLTASIATIHSGQTATMVSVTYDAHPTPSISFPPLVYVSYYDSGSQNGHTFAIDSHLNTILAPTLTVAGQALTQLTSYADAGVCTFLYEVFNTYAYNGARTDYIRVNTITQAGVVGTASFMSREVGLASKAFAMNGVIYALVAYDSPFQPTYFLMSTLGNIIAKLAYSNGGGYYQQALPSVILNGSTASIPYLVKDFIASLSKENAAVNTAGIYSQTGVNLATFQFSPSQIVTSEMGNNLNISGGMLWAYDGTTLDEQGFHLYPDYIAVTPSSPTISITADTTDGSPIITGAVSTAGLIVGMRVTGTNVPTGSTIISITPTTFTITANATGTGSGLVFTLTGALMAQKYFYQVIYEWTDNQGNIIRSSPSIPVGHFSDDGSMTTLDIPTLRLTYKTDVHIQIYRWSTQQQIYYEITQINQPLLSDKTVDFVTFLDLFSDAQILGNSIIYTEGGVLENIPPPSVNSMTMFQDRLFTIDAEDPNQLFFSKQVIAGTPVEMSDLLSVYVAPSTGVQSSTGPILAIAPMDDKLIIFKKDAMYYINGQGPDNTGANNQFSDATTITATVGCGNQLSIAPIPAGLIFESDKGIWLLGRDLSTQYIGAPVEKYTQDARVLTTISVPGTNQVRFSLSSGVTLMYDYYFGQWGTFSNVPATSSVVYQGVQAYLDALGRVYQETPNVFLDGSSPVLMNFTTSWVNVAGLQGFERIYYFYLLATWLSPHKLTVSIGYDYNDAPTQSSIIVPDNYSPAWGGLPLWGSGEVWGGPGNIEQWRVFTQTQKCQSFQISIAESFDASIGPAAGAGFVMSGLDMVIGTKKGYPTLRPSRSVG